MVPKKAQKFKRKKNFSGFKNHSILSSIIVLAGKDHLNSNIDHNLLRVIPVQHSGPKLKNGSIYSLKSEDIASTASFYSFSKRLQSMKYLLNSISSGSAVPQNIAANATQAALILASQSVNTPWRPRKMRHSVGHCS